MKRKVTENMKAHLSAKTAAKLLAALCTMVLTCAVKSGHAQDLHFSQFMNNPLLTNPANAGFNPDYDYRIGASYRSQWTNIPVPYKTMSLWGDWQAFRDRFENGWMGLGGAILRDVAGSGNLTSTKVYGTVSYHQELGYKSLLSGGFNIGYASKSVDFTKFRFENQWTGKFFDANYPTGENFAYSRVGYLDIQMGLNYAYFANDNVYLNGGVSLMHVNEPKETFFSENQNDNSVPMRYAVFANASVKLNDQWIINPNAYYTTQAGSREIVGGLMAQYNLSGDGETQLLGGAYYRYQDAAVAMIGLELKNFRFTFTYDATTSALKTANSGIGGTEFSLIKFGNYIDNSGLRDVRCPSFKN